MIGLILFLAIYVIFLGRCCFKYRPERTVSVPNRWFRPAAKYLMQKVRWEDSEDAGFRRVHIDKYEYGLKTRIRALQGIAVGVLLLLIQSIFNQPQVLTELIRPGHGESGTETTVRFRRDEEYGELSLSVPAMEYTPEELEKKREVLRKKLEEELLGDNESVDQVVRPLHLITELSGIPAEIYWDYQGEHLLPDGRLRPSPEGPVQLPIEAVLVFSDGKELREKFELTLPKAEKVGESAGDYVKIESDRLVLPDTIGGEHVEWFTGGEDGGFRFFLIPVLVAVWIVFRRQHVKNLIGEREAELLREYPGLVQRFLLYLQSGLSVTQAWMILTEAYGPEAHRLREELIKSRHRLQAGIGMEEVFREFADSCDLKEYRKLAQLITQNIRSGADTILQALHQEAEDARREGKKRAEEAGRKAETALLGPMMVMLIVVFLVLLAPGLLTIKG